VKRWSPHQLDLWLLDRVAQPVVDWLGRRWGVDHIKLGANLTKIASILLLVYGVVRMHEIQAEGHPFIGAFVGLTWLLVSGVWRPLVWRAALHARLGHANINRVLLVVARQVTLALLIGQVVMFFMPPIDAVFGLTVGFHLLNAAGFYILSCQKPPPQEVRQPAAQWVPA
jgi:hypothetical protein